MQDLEKVMPGITKLIGGHRVISGDRTKVSSSMAQDLEKVMPRINRLISELEVMSP